MHVKFESPVQWVCAKVATSQSLQSRFQNNSVVRFALISAALVSQILGLILAGFLGILIGSAAVIFLR